MNSPTNFIYLPTLQHTGTWFLINFLLSHLSITGFCETHVIFNALQGKPFKTSYPSIKRGIASYGITLLQSHIIMSNDERNNNLHHLQKALLVSNPFVFLLRDPLRSLITHKAWGHKPDYIYAIQIYKTFYEAVSILLLEGHQIEFFPIDILTKKEEEREAKLRQVLSIYNLSPSSILTKTWARNWPVHNSSKHRSIDIDKVAQAYEEGDLAPIKKLLPLEFLALREAERNLRPILEQAGYSNLLWWS